MKDVNCISSLALALAIVGGTTISYAEGDATRGEKKFADCAACHSLQEGVNNMGPSLHGLFNRKAGSLAYFRYSPAMKRSGIVWTAQTLDEFLTEPQKLVPANRMPYGGISEPAERADLIAYLTQAAK